MSQRPEILFIDGDLVLNKILAHHLDSLNIQLIVCRNGGELKELLQSNRIWNQLLLIILERNLEDIDGLELIELLNKKFFKKIPILFLTEFGTDEDIMEGLREGAIDYVIKPFNLEIFIEKIRSLVLWQKEQNHGE